MTDYLTLKTSHVIAYCNLNISMISVHMCIYCHMNKNSFRFKLVIL